MKYLKSFSTQEEYDNECKLLKAESESEFDCMIDNIYQPQVVSARELEVADSIFLPSQSEQLVKAGGGARQTDQYYSRISHLVSMKLKKTKTCWYDLTLYHFEEGYRCKYNMTLLEFINKYQPKILDHDYFNKIDVITEEMIEGWLAYDKNAQKEGIAFFSYTEFTYSKKRQILQYIHAIAEEDYISDEGISNWIANDQTIKEWAKEIGVRNFYF